MNKAEDIEQLIYRELPPDRYCYIHNFILEKDKEIERLEEQLQQKENIIKELEKLLDTKYYGSEFDNYLIVEGNKGK